MTLNFCLFGFIGTNFNALAMDPLGHVAGTASSVLGFMQTFGGGLFGAVIGYFYNGTVIPMLCGFIVLSLLSSSAWCWPKAGCSTRSTTRRHRAHGRWLRRTGGIGRHRSAGGQRARLIGEPLHRPVEVEVVRNEFVDGERARGRDRG